MNRGTYRSGSKSNAPYFIGATVQQVSAASADIILPKGFSNGDLILIGVGTRNATLDVPAGWSRIQHKDASGNEWNDIFLKYARDEPPTVTFTFSLGTLASFVACAFGRKEKLYRVYDDWRITPESAPQLTGVKDGIYVAMACDAASVNHVTSFTGLTPIGGTSDVNTSCFMAWKRTQEGVSEGAFPASPTGASFDGYSGWVFG